MFKGFKEREFALGDKVRVYRNLNNGCWSVKAMSGEFRGKVVAHLDEITLVDVDFVIYETGRQRVIAEKRKNVHAYAQGFLSDISACKDINKNNEVTYDPYKSGFFYLANKDFGVIEQAKKMSFFRGKAYI